MRLRVSIFPAAFPCDAVSGTAHCAAALAKTATAATAAATGHATAQKMRCPSV